MKQFKGTKSDWSFRGEHTIAYRCNDPIQTIYKILGGGKLVEKPISIVYYNDGEGQYNAKLIAAAPDLLQAAKNSIWLWNKIFSKHLDENKLTELEKDTIIGCKEQLTEALEKAL